jgi:ribose transport system ATP-binding protein
VSTSALRVRRVSKSFGGVHALKSVSLEVEGGEIHGLLGENGSGKSTLIKILAGFHSPEPGGQMWVHDQPVRLPVPPGAFRALGLSFVHQDLGLIPSLTAVENLFIGELVSGWRWNLSWKHQRRRARAVFEKFGVAIDPEQSVAEMTQVERAMLAIIRAVEDTRGPGTDARASQSLLVLDEPTVFLPRAGVDQLFNLIRNTVAHGASVLFVSHDLDEVREITDRVTVLRDGCVEGTVNTPETTPTELIEMIIGRRLVPGTSEHQPATRKVHISATVEAEGIFPFHLCLYRGEILGLTGLAGSGYERLPYFLFGASVVSRGSLTINGREVPLTTMTPRQAIELGMVLLPSNRQQDGSVGELTVAENVMLPVLNRYTRHFRLSWRSVLDGARQLLTRFGVRPNRPSDMYHTLSGGNQQKALLAKWLQLTPEVMLLDEPTQGVDVGAREQIFTIINESAQRGASVICASSDYEQLARLCHRVIVFARGRAVRELSGQNISKEVLTHEAYNSLSLLETLEAQEAQGKGDENV